MTIAEAVAATNFGVASARKRGSNSDFPYVPVIEHGRRSSWSAWVSGEVTTRNPVKGAAYATREDAVAAAQRHIDAQRADLAAKLADPRYRALREHHGLPRELSEVSS